MTATPRGERGLGEESGAEEWSGVGEEGQGWRHRWGHAKGTEASGMEMDHWEGPSSTSFSFLCMCVCVFFFFSWRQG